MSQPLSSRLYSGRPPHLSGPGAGAGAAPCALRTPLSPAPGAHSLQYFQIARLMVPVPLPSEPLPSCPPVKTPAPGKLLGPGCSTSFPSSFGVCQQPGPSPVIESFGPWPEGCPSSLGITLTSGSCALSIQHLYPTPRSPTSQFHSGSPPRVTSRISMGPAASWEF